MRQNPYEINPTDAVEGNTMGVDSTGTVRFVEDSVVTILLEAGSTAADVPVDTPDRTIVRIKA